MHRAFSFIVYIRHYDLYFLPGTHVVILPPFEEVKAPVSNSADFFPKKCPLEDFWRILEDLWWLGLVKGNNIFCITTFKRK